MGGDVQKELDRKHDISAYEAVPVVASSREKAEWSRPTSDATRTDRKEKKREKRVNNESD